MFGNDFGFVLGGSYEIKPDFYIDKDSENLQFSFSNLGYSYELPNELEYGSNEA